jgi:hypothetical protein
MLIEEIIEEEAKIRRKNYKKNKKNKRLKINKNS